MMCSRFHFGGKLTLLLLCSVFLAVLFCGCGGDETLPTAASPTIPGTTGTATTPPSSTDATGATNPTVSTVPTEPTVPPTTPPNGDPDNVTCKGSYTDGGAAAAANTVVASLGDAELTNGQLQVYYWLEVAAWQRSGQEISPDFTKDLDTQRCELDDTAVTWQQFFLKRALNTWHTAQALTLRGQNEAPTLEEAYQPNAENHEKYMVGMPALNVLYGYKDCFVPNELHQAYLDNLSGMLDDLAAQQGFADASAMIQDMAGSAARTEDMLAYAEIFNRGYMYYTELSYDLTHTEEEISAYFEANKATFADLGITADSGKYADIRHILVLPEGTVGSDGKVTATEEQWEAGLKAAQAIEREYKKIYSKNPRVAHPRSADAIFADLANKNSRDSGTALDGGLYQNIRKGQLMDTLDQWVFAEERQAEDVAILKTDYGYHILFFRGSEEIWHAEAESALTAQKLSQEIAAARTTYPMTVDYSSIRLGVAERASAAVTPGDILYADIAHERYPSVPLYLQQDYPDTMYGSFKITSHGCGITTLAMLASYMTDTEQTPPEMCALYGEYSYVTGTDGIMFINVPPEMGFYLIKKSHNPAEVKQAMMDGRLIVCVQNKGYWTRGGHYLVVEKMFEDETVQVRDSNIFNYGKLELHKEDRFPWTTIPPSCVGYWIFQDKITAIPACSRCGTQQDGCSVLEESYLCRKCVPALIRRESYLTACGLDF